MESDVHHQPGARHVHAVCAGRGQLRHLRRPRRPHAPGAVAAAGRGASPSPNVVPGHAPWAPVVSRLRPPRDRPARYLQACGPAGRFRRTRCALRSPRQARASRRTQRAEVRHASARIAVPPICGGPLDRRAQRHFASVLRSATPTHLRGLPLILRWVSATVPGPPGPGRAAAPAR
jgi:hypothetical protein